MQIGIDLCLHFIFWSCWRAQANKQARSLQVHS